MARIAADHIGLREAAEMFGVSVDTLRRRIRDNQLDEAQLVQGPFGATWVLPRSSLAAIAVREHWDIETDSAGSGVSREAGPGHSGGPTSTNGPASSTIDLRAPSLAVPAPESGDRVSRPEVAQPPTDQPAEPAATSLPEEEPVVILDPDLATAISAELSATLAVNIEAELAAVREAITAAEVRAVSAEARSEALTGEQNRLQAQLKRAEADVEYWRSQHDRLDKELDRERSQRTSADTARAVAETELREATRRSTELASELEQQRRREQDTRVREAETRAELDQALMAMGWWSRRRLARVQSRSAGRSRPAAAGD